MTVALAAVLTVVMLAIGPLVHLAPDSYLLLYAGRWIARHGIPHAEVFTIAAHGRRWVDQQWLAELVDFELWRAGGYAAVALVNGTLLGLAYAAVAALILRRGGSVVVALAATALAVTVGGPSLFLRAEDLVVVLFVALVALCLTDAERDRPGLRLLGLLPLLVLWANLHGSVLLGVGLAIAYLAYRGGQLLRRSAWRPAGDCLALSVLVALTPLATPYGTQIIHYYRELLANPTISVAEAEWHAPVVGQASFVVFVVPLLLALAVSLVAGLRRERPPVLLFGLATVTGVAAATAARNTVWFGIAAALYAGAVAEGWVATQRPARGFVRGLGAGAAILGVLGVGLLAAPGEAGYEASAPLRAIAAAASYASAHPCARILGDDAAGSALLWHDPWLAGRVGFDARLEQYPQPSLERWFRFERAQAPDWPSTTAGYEVLVGTAGESPALTGRLRGLPGAAALGRDARGVAVLNPFRAAMRCGAAG